MEIILLILALAIAFVWILESLSMITIGILLIVAIFAGGIWDEFKKLCHILVSSRHYKGKDEKDENDRSSDDL